MAKEMSFVSAATKEPADSIDVYRKLLIQLCIANGGSVHIPKPNLEAVGNAMYRVTINPVADGVVLQLVKTDRH